MRVLKRGLPNARIGKPRIGGRSQSGSVTGVEQLR
jgi:hypothetical protein